MRIKKNKLKPMLRVRTVLLSLENSCMRKGLIIGLQLHHFLFDPRATILVLCDQLTLTKSARQWRDLLVEGSFSSHKQKHFISLQSFTRHYQLQQQNFLDFSWESKAFFMNVQTFQEEKKTKIRKEEPKFTNSVALVMAFFAAENEN